MQSKQIQLFGFIGSAVLILFIVIFMGKDFYNLFLKYNENLLFLPVSDVQVSQEASAAVAVEDKIAKKSEVSQKSDVEKAPVVAKKKENVSSPELQKSIVSEASFDLSTVNKEIRAMLGTVPFFRYSMALTSKNKAVLNSVSEKLTALPYSYTLDIEGHTEAGISAHVSETMATRVEAYLKRKLPGVTIRTIGYANAYPIIDDPKNRENRRVEIIVRRSDG